MMGRSPIFHGKATSASRASPQKKRSRMIYHDLPPPYPQMSALQAQKH